MRCAVGKVFLSIGLSFAACSTAVFAADDRVPVTITACVQPGTLPGTYVLTHVEQLAGGTAVPADAVYWLSTTKGLKEQVGRTIEVSGTFSPKRDAGKIATVKVASNLGTGEEKIAIENGAKRAETKNDFRPVGTAGVKSEIARPYRRLEVASIRTLRPSCP